VEVAVKIVMAEDWSGEFVNQNLHPFIIFNRETQRINVPEFWSLVRKVLGLPESA
jgi:hypothetical protein